MQHKKKRCCSDRFSGMLQIQSYLIYHNNASKPITALTDLSRAVENLRCDISDQVETALLELQIVICSYDTPLRRVY